MTQTDLLVLDWIRSAQDGAAPLAAARLIPALTMVAIAFAVLVCDAHVRRRRARPLPRGSSLFRSLRRAALAIVLVLGTAVAAGAAWFFTHFPVADPAPALTIERTPERLARGEYLARHVVGCVACHGRRDWRYYSGPAIRGTEGHAGPPFDVPVGTIAAPNITPDAIGDWTEGELLRAMTSGVSRDGSALFPLMPYEAFAHLSRADAYAVVAYIRTLPASSTRAEPRRLSFPLNVLVRTMPKPTAPVPAAPAPGDTVAYGRYLTTVAACSDCHTQRDQGKPRPGMAFAGGAELRLPDGTVQRSANITPDVETGIGAWSEARFIARFKQAADTPLEQTAVGRGAQTDMPWRDYGGMTRDDLAAIYAYLRTLAPVRHRVAR